MSDSVQSHRRQPTRLPCPWDSPGKNTGVGCHFLLQCMKGKSESEVAQSCPTLVTPWTAAHQAPLSMGFSRQKYWSRVPLLVRRKAFWREGTECTKAQRQEWIWAEWSWRGASSHSVRLFFHTLSWGIYYLWILFGGTEAQRGPGLGPGRKWEHQDSFVVSTCKFSEVREYTSEKPKWWPLWSLLPLLPGSRQALSHCHQKLPGWTGSGRFLSLGGVLGGLAATGVLFMFLSQRAVFTPSLYVLFSLLGGPLTSNEHPPHSFFSHDPSMFLTVKLFIPSSVGQLGADWGLDRGAAMCLLPPWPLNHTKMPQGL